MKQQKANEKYEIDSDLGKITICPFEPMDIPARLAYIYDSPMSYLEKIGFDVEHLPARKEMEKQLNQQYLDELETGFFTRVVARLNNRTIAICILDPHDNQKSPNIHFHIFDPQLRGKELGIRVFSVALKMFQGKFV